jgi:hypothetical protein
LEEVAANETLSLEEKEIKVNQLTEYYTGKLKYWTDEANKFMSHSKDINNQYNTDMAANFNETIMGSMY